MNYITVDGGTTNTRLYLVEDGAVTQTIRLPLGAGDGKDALAPAVKDAIAALLNKQPNVTRILASGMITCENGLYELPHIVAPAGIAELHQGMKEVFLPDIAPVPFVFIPGVKTVGVLADTDMMRGEETELIGLELPPQSTCVLPGSHNKWIETDEAGRISKFRTMMTGELLAAVTGNTILKDAVDLSAGLSRKALLDGFRYCREHGMNEALFKVRILKNLFQGDPDTVYSFCLGVLLYGEIYATRDMKTVNVFIGGKAQLKEALYLLLGELSVLRHKISEEDVNVATARGAVKIYEY